MHHVDIYRWHVDTQAIEDAIQVLQQSFSVKKPTTLEDYLGVQVIKSKDGKQAWLGQPTIIKNWRRCSQMMYRLHKVH